MKKFVTICIVFLAILMQGNILAQKESYNWCFGFNTGVTFNAIANGLPVAIKTKIWTEEGCSSISDSAGNLLFYTDGVTVYTKNHNIMTNGQNLKGSYSSAQSAIIIPMIDSPDKYYIFTADCGTYLFNKFTNEGINYSIVDMKKQNGEGEVTTKNIFLYKPSTEAMTAVRHRNGKDIWLLTHEMFSNKYRSNLITSEGISSYPILSICGPVTDFDGYHWPQDIAMMKVSQDGKKLALSEFCNWSIQLCDFNNLTGKIKYAKTLKTDNFTYGIEFSPDGTLLYVSIFNKIIQCNLYSYNNSCITIHSDTAQACSFLIGIDKKIYVAIRGSKYLAVINDPDKLGNQCSFVHNGIYLNGDSCCIGLPNFVNNVISQTDINVTTNSPVCENEKLFLYSDCPLNANYKWTGPNGFTSLLRNPVIENATSANSGTYFLDVNLNGQTYKLFTEVTINLKPSVKIYPNKKPIICEGQKIKLTNNFSPDATYHWSTGETNYEIIVNKSGTYWLYGESENGCKDSSSIIITVLSNITASITGKTEFCYGDSVNLSAYPLDSSYIYLWSTGEVTQNIKVTEPGKYKVVVSLNGQCADSAEITVKSYPKPSVFLLGPLIACENSNHQYGCSYRGIWDTVIVENGEMVQTNKSNLILVHWDTPGFGKLKLVTYDSISGCKGSDSLIVEIIENPTPVITYNKLSFCEGDSVLLTSVKDYKTYLWAKILGPGWRKILEDNKNIYIKEPGKYCLVEYNSLNCEGVSDTVIITQNLKPIVTITGKTEICTGDTAILSTNQDFVSYLWNTGENTKSIYAIEPGSYSVTVTDSNGCTNIATTNISSIIANLEGIKDIDFGTVGTLSDSVLEVTIKNEGIYDVKINEIKIFGLEGNAFSFDKSLKTPIGLRINDSLKIKIKFNPTKSKSYLDSVIIVTDEPCRTRFPFKLSGKSEQKNRTIIWIPNLTAKIGDNNFCIPIFARLADSIKLKDTLSYTAEVRYDASALVPKGNYQVENGDRVITLSGNGIIFTDNDIELGNFCGDVYLANQDVTPLRITDFRWNNPNIDTIKQNGSLKITGLCQRDIARLQLISNFDFIINSNPVTDFLQISGIDPKLKHGVDKVEIYDILGILYTPPNPLLIEGEQLRVDVSGIVPGVYFVKVGDRVLRFVKM